MLSNMLPLKLAQVWEYFSAEDVDLQKRGRNGATTRIQTFFAPSYPSPFVAWILSNYLCSKQGSLAGKLRILMKIERARREINSGSALHPSLTAT